MVKSKREQSKNKTKAGKIKIDPKGKSSPNAPTINAYSKLGLSDLFKREPVNLSLDSLDFSKVFSSQGQAQNGMQLNKPSATGLCDLTLSIPPIPLTMPTSVPALVQMPAQKPSCTSSINVCNKNKQSKENNDVRLDLPPPPPPVEKVTAKKQVSKTSGWTSEDKGKHTGGRWSQEEDNRLKQVVKELGPKNWKVISKKAFNGSRSDVQCLHRWQKVLKPGLVKGPWTAKEDAIIVDLINTHGIGNIKWSEISYHLPGRLGKQCRERWVNHLDPNLKKGPWSQDEDRILFEQHAALGNKWRDIAAQLPGRSENSVKNRWNSAKRRKKRSEQALKAGKKPGSSKRRRKKAKPPSLLDNIELTSPKAAAGSGSTKPVSMKKPTPLAVLPPKKAKKAKTTKASKSNSKQSKASKAKKTMAKPKAIDLSNTDISLPPLPPSIFEHSSDPLSSSAIEWSFGISSNPSGSKDDSGSTTQSSKGTSGVSDLNRLTSLSPIFGDLGLGSCMSAQTGLSAFSSLAGSRGGFSPPPPIDLTTSSLLKPGLDALSLEITGHGLTSKQFYKSRSRKEELQPEVLGMNDDLELFLIEDLIDVTPI